MKLFSLFTFRNASFAAMISITMKSSKTNQTIDSKSPENIESQAQNKNLSNLGYFNELKTMKKVPISQPYETKNLLINENFHEKILPSGLQTYEKDNPRTLNDQFQNKCLVLNWVDYSNKYGIGYLLNNGYYGVFFNDSTKMLMKEEDLFYYIEKNRSESEQLMPYSINNCPLELNKKAVLMKHFVSYLNENLEVLIRKSDLLNLK